jgi:hypothetical protein
MVDLPQDIPVQPVAFERIRIICPQAVVHLCVHAEYALVVWRVAVGSVRF